MATRSEKASLVKQNNTSEDASLVALYADLRKLLLGQKVLKVDTQSEPYLGFRPHVEAKTSKYEPLSLKDGHSIQIIERNQVAKIHAVFVQRLNEYKQTYPALFQQNLSNQELLNEAILLQWLLKNNINPLS